MAGWQAPIPARAGAAWPLMPMAARNRQAGAHGPASGRQHGDCGCACACGPIASLVRPLPGLRQEALCGHGPIARSRCDRQETISALRLYRRRPWDCRHGFCRSPARHSAQRPQERRPCRADGAYACGWGHPQRLIRNVAREPAYPPILPRQKLRDRFSPAPPSCPCRAGGKTHPCACLSTPPRCSAVRRDWGLSLKLSTAPRKAPRSTHAAGVIIRFVGQSIPAQAQSAKRFFSNGPRPPATAWPTAKRRPKPAAPPFPHIVFPRLSFF